MTKPFYGVNKPTMSKSRKSLPPKAGYLPIAHRFTRLASALMTVAVLAGSSISVFAAPNESTDYSKSMPSPQYSTDGIVALVEEMPVLKSELKQAMSDTMTRIEASGQPAPSQASLQSKVLNSLILRKLQLNMIKRAGIRPEPDAVHQQLVRIAQTQGLNSLTQLQKFLDLKQAGTYANLRNQVIEEESLKALQQSQIGRRVRITEQDIEAFLASPEAKRLERTEYRTIHIRIPFIDDYTRITEAQKTQALDIAKRAQALLTNSNNAQAVLQQLSDGVAQTYPLPVQGGDMGYHEASGLPQEIASSITPLEIGQVTEPQITPQGIDIIKLIDKRGNTQMVIPQWKVRHILIESNDAKNDGIAEQQINDIYEQLRADADFADLASTYSNDPGSAGRGGDLDWVTEDQMVPEFEEMIKRTPVGDFSTPFKSQFGWHILKVEDSRQKDVSDNVKRNLARAALFQRLAPQAQEDWLQELRANAYIKILD